MTRSLPIVFNQTDYLQPLGLGSATISAVGCYLCSFSTLAKACGKDVTPISLNNLFIDKQLYVNRNEMVDDNLTKAFPDVVYQESLNYENIPADLDKLRTLLADSSTWVILEIDLGNNFTHFVLCAGINGVVSIADSMTGTIIDFASEYGDPMKNILKFVVYKGSPAIMDGSTEQQAIIDQLRTDRDNNWNSYIAEQTKNAELTTENTNLQKNIAEVQARNAILANEIAKMEQADSTAVDKGVQLQGLVTDLTDYIHALSDSLGVKWDSAHINNVVESSLQVISSLKRPQPVIQTPVQQVVSAVKKKTLWGSLLGFVLTSRQKT